MPSALAPSALADRAARLRTWPGGTRALLGAGAAIVLLLGAVLAWVLWGGGGHSGTAYPPGLVPSAATPPPAAAAPPGGGAPPASAHPGATGGTDPANQAAKGFLDELGAIDPRLAANPDAALANGRATCQDLAARLPDETVRAHVAQRFHLGTSTEDQAKSALIADAARNHLCP
jgi:Protein of unknown function (DUF732)